MAGINPLAGIPRTNLPRNISYHPSEDRRYRLLINEKPPYGWWGNITWNKTDFSDCRRWHAPEKSQQDSVWRALGPTLKEYSVYTNTTLTRTDVRCLELGYEAAYAEIMRKLNTWAFDHLGFNHEWTHRGKLTKSLFKLERWYGTMQDYRFAPNWPIPQYSVAHGRKTLLQNPEVRACVQCLRRNILCHGHRENPDFVCTPCLKHGRKDRCTKSKCD